MKLNVVADRLQSTLCNSIVRRIAVLGVFLYLLSAGSGFALDGIDLNEPVEAPAGGECSKLVQIKYPFLRCSDGEIGLADRNASWEVSRQIPPQSGWIEGDAWWGPELNRD
jgi:hypothetical protein